MRPQCNILGQKYNKNKTKIELTNEDKQKKNVVVMNYLC